MTIYKKDFIKIAEIIQHSKTVPDKSLVNAIHLIEGLCDYFEEQNNKFNIEWFKKACEYDKSYDALKKGYEELENETND